MVFVNAKYATQQSDVIEAERDGQIVFVPTDPQNADYLELLESSTSIAPYVAPVIPLADQARAELARTDLAWGARLAEDSVAVAGGKSLDETAAAKIAYRQALRAIANGTNTTATDLPTDPTEA